MAREVELIRQLGFEGALIDIDKVFDKFPDYTDVAKTEATKVYFSGGKPSVFFLEVPDFSDLSLAKIARVHHNIWNYQT